MIFRETGKIQKMKNLPSRWEISVLGAKIEWICLISHRTYMRFCLNSLKLFKVFQEEIRLLFSVRKTFKIGTK